MDEHGKSEDNSINWHSYNVVKLVACQSKSSSEPEVQVEFKLFFSRLEGKRLFMTH